MYSYGLQGLVISGRKDLVLSRGGDNLQYRLNLKAGKVNTLVCSCVRFVSGP